MTLWAHVHGGYASYDNQHAWGQAEYDAFKLVQALKGKQIRGYARLRAPNGQWLTFTSANPGNAFRIWSEWAAGKLAEIAPQGGLLVPVPSSDCIAPGGDAKGRKLALAAAAHAARVTAVDALHWHEQWPKAAEGGSRDADVLYGNIRVRHDLQPQNVILVDDVVTLGGHLIACARALRSRGHTVEHALCAAHTVKSPPAGGMFAIPSWDVEANPVGGIFDLLG